MQFGHPLFKRLLWRWLRRCINPYLTLLPSPPFPPAATGAVTSTTADLLQLKPSELTLIAVSL